MISKEQVLEAATTACEIVNKNTENNLSIAKISVNKANNIVIYLQKLTNVTIDDCANVSKEIEKLLDRDVEDFSLTVSSMGSK
jgi:ribosome maturation factor RimP